MEKLLKRDIKEINRLRALFPSQISVRVYRSKDGGFCAEILTFLGCYTEAETLSELVEMVNDAAKTYFEVPGKYISFVPSYIMPIKVAQELGVFPINMRQHKIELSLVGREKVNR